MKGRGEEGAGGRTGVDRKGTLTGMDFRCLSY